MGLDQYAIGKIVANGMKDVSEWLEGSEVRFKTIGGLTLNTTGGREWLQFKHQTGISDSRPGLAMGIQSVATSFSLSRDGETILMQPRDQKPNYVGVRSPGSLYPSRFVTWTSNKESTYVKLSFNFAPANTSDDFSGITEIRWAHRTTDKLNNTGVYTKGSLTKLENPAADQWWAVYFDKMGPALANEYYARKISESNFYKKVCCNRDYGGNITQLRCEMANMIPEEGNCDNYMKNFCSTDDGKSDPTCDCINSPLIQKNMPAGCDVNCARGSSYLTYNDLRAVNSGCTYMDCTQILNLSAGEKSVASPTMIQNCEVTTRDGGGAAVVTPRGTGDSRELSSTGVGDDGKIVKKTYNDGPSIDDIMDKARKDEYAKSYRNEDGSLKWYASINKSIEDISPGLFESIPDIGVEIVDDMSGLVVMMVVLVAIVYIMGPAKVMASFGISGGNGGFGGIGGFRGGFIGGLRTVVGKGYETTRRVYTGFRDKVGLRI